MRKYESSQEQHEMDLASDNKFRSSVNTEKFITKKRFWDSEAPHPDVNRTNSPLGSVLRSTVMPSLKHRSTVKSGNPSIRPSTPNTKLYNNRSQEKFSKTEISREFLSIDHVPKKRKILNEEGFSNKERVDIVTGTNRTTNNEGENAEKDAKRKKSEINIEGKTSKNE